MPFSELIGHTRPLHALRRALGQGRLPHALLLVGPSGIGKERIARALAQTLLCTARVGGEDPDACGECAQCRKVERRQHPDVLWVVSEETAIARKWMTRDDLDDSKRRPSREIRVRQVRELTRQVALKPYEAESKIAVIAEAEHLNAEAQNCLLKTLEEPPAGTHLVLVTDRASLLLPTVRSRCQRLAFAPLTPQDSAEVLRRHGVAADESDRAAALGGGSPGRSLALLESGALALRDEVAALFDAGAALPWPELFATAEKVAKDPATLALWLELVGLHVRDALVCAFGGDALAREAHVAPDMMFAALKHGRAWGPDALLAVSAAAASGQRALDGNANARFVAESVLIALQRGAPRLPAGRASATRGAA